jgi:DNA-binding LacI/PurR family transcriptional regulator
VQRAARKLGYVPDRAAASLRNGRSHLVALITDEPVGSALQVLAAQAVERGCMLVVARASDVGVVEARGVDAAVVSGSDKAASAWSKTGRPLVVLGSGRLPRGAVRVPAGAGDDVLAEACASLFG